jgi:hypothetical protein
MPVLAQVVRDVEAAVQRGRVVPSVKTKFQVVALLVREERARLKADKTIGEARRGEQLKRLDGIAVILAKTAARNTSLLALLDDDAVISDSARSLRRELLTEAGVEVPPDEPEPPEPATATAPLLVGSCRSRSCRASSPTRSSPPTSRPSRSVRRSRAA